VLDRNLGREYLTRLGDELQFPFAAKKIAVEEGLELSAAREVPDDPRDEFDPDEEVPRVLVGVEGAVFELWLQP